MKLSYFPVELTYKYPFGISSNTRFSTTSIIVKLSWEEFSGYGEACLPPYLDEKPADCIRFIENAKSIVRNFDYPCSIAEVIMELDELDDKNNSAKAALDIALHDLKGKIENKTVRELYRMQGKKSYPTACTIGIDKEETLKQKISEANNFPILKIKAGTVDDKKLIQLIRKYTDKPLYVDVNQGWNEVSHAIELIAWMKEQGVVLIEQPLPTSMKNEMLQLKEKSVLPLIADESIKRLADIYEQKDLFHGINIKLMKCTGLNEAYKMIELAKQLELKIFLGCMAESSCATAAMAQFAVAADFIDLDAPLLLKEDPFTGLQYINGEIVLPEEAGIGVSPMNSEMF